MTQFELEDGTLVALIGDPHMGRRFETGVPLARRGEREKLQMGHLKAELSSDADIVVIIGDLFDTPFVGYGVVQEVTAAVREAVEARPHVQFIVIAGNHDLPRNVGAVGAFHDFRERLDGRYENLFILLQPRVLFGIAFFPWEWSVTSADQARSLDLDGVEAAVGHWDLSSFDGKDDHLAPLQALPDGLAAYSGHYHVGGRYDVAGGYVTCTGSLQPYTHGEDPDQLMYITLSRADALERDDLKNMNVRVRLKPGEDLPAIDALSVIGLLEKGEINREDPELVTAATFNWNDILKARLDPLDQKVQDFIYERLPSNGDSETED